MHRCTCCGSVGTEQKIFDFGSLPFTTQYMPTRETAFRTHPLVLYACGNCDFCFLKDPVDSELLYADGYSETSVNAAPHIPVLVDEIMSRLPKPDKSFVVEIGSNDGHLLRLLTEGGVGRCLGIEPSRNCAQVARESGVPTIKEFFDRNLAERIVSEYRMPDLVICRNVLEHVPEPVEFLRAFLPLLDVDTDFLVELPHFTIIKRQGMFMNIMEQHPNYFTLNNLKQVFESVGLHIHATALHAYGGSARTIWSSLTPCRQKIHENGEPSSVEFSETCRKNMNELREIIYYYIGKGKKIAGYGVGTRGISIINNMGIGGALSYVVDDHPQKQNRFLPGSLLPIRPSEVLTKREKTDLCLLFPMSEKKVEARVLGRLRPYIQNGGRVLEFYPGDFRSPTAFCRIHRQ